jgi:hypothetical protein
VSTEDNEAESVKSESFAERNFHGARNNRMRFQVSEEVEAGHLWGRKESLCSPFPRFFFRENDGPIEISCGNWSKDC